MQNRSNIEPLVNDQIRELKQVFKLFDKNGDGAITKNELREVMNSLSQEPTSEELDEMIQEVDKNGDNEIDFQEFRELMTNRLTQIDEEQEAVEAFHVFDRSNTGRISAQDLSTVMKNLGEDLTMEEIEELIQYADKDNDGFISFEEFKELMKDT